jgi:hypothetical protein
MKTASRIFVTFAILVFFTGFSFAQVASTAKSSTKSTTEITGKVSDGGKTAGCANHEAKGACAQGQKFVDKNGDGKCDNCGLTGKCKETGNCVTKGNNCGTSCDKGKGTGSCCPQGQRKSGCSGQSSTPAADPKK